MTELLKRRWMRRRTYRREGSPFIWAEVRDTRSGKLWAFSTKKTSEKEANQAVLDWTDEQEEREKPRPKEAGFADAYREFLGLKTCKPITLDEYKLDLERLYAPFFGERTVRGVELADVERFLKALREGQLQKTGRKAGPRTQRKHVGALRSFFAWARRRKLTDENPCEGLKVGKGERRKTVPLTYEEARKLLAAASEPVVLRLTDRRRPDGWEQRAGAPPHLRLAVALGLFAGFRRRTLCSLRWSHVDLGARRIDVPGELMKMGEAHSVPIAEPLLGLLEEARRKTEKVDGLVLGIEVKSFMAALHGACRRAGIRRISPHCLRHTLASWLSATGTPLPTVAAILGHGAAQGNFNPITGAYVHPSWDEMVAAIERVGAAPSQRRAVE